MWVDNFNGLSRLDQHIKDILNQKATLKTINKDNIIFGLGIPPNQLIFLINGTIRVQQTSPNGREIILYRVHAGESCVLTTACLLAYEDYLAEGIAETDIKVAAVPQAVFEDLLSTSQDFRHFVFTAYSRRVTELFHLIQEVTFTKIDIRLADKLLQLATNNKIRNLTHQDLAIEMGSAREVITRQLQEFQRRGWVKLGRSAIDILDPIALEKQSNPY